MPIIRKTGAWLMERGISPGEPGWYFVPFVSALAAPLMLFILAAAVVYEIANRLFPREVDGGDSGVALGEAFRS